MPEGDVRARGTRSRALGLLAACTLLSWCVNIRLPAPTSGADWLRPSPDVVVLLACLALFAPRPAWTPPRSWLWFLAACFLLLRLGRVADGVCRRYLDRPFHLVADLTLVPEFARLLRSSLGPGRFAFWSAAVLLALALLSWLLLVALRHAARALSEPRLGDAYLVLAGVLGALSFGILPAFGAAQASLYSAPVTPRLVHELELWLTARGIYDDPAHFTQRRAFAQRYRARQAELRAAKSTLPGLAGADVQLLLVEAYGQTVMATPSYLEELMPAYRELGSTLEHAGYSVCTELVRATVFGGNSWLTHATVQSALPIGDQFEYELLLEQRDVFTLAKAFSAAGYRSVSVKPGTTRASPLMRVYGFEQEYPAWSFDYHGPSYAWAPMPDQFVLQRLAERELRDPKRPLFIETALVSSHFPFTPQPPYVEDWSTLGDGSVFQRLAPIAFRGPRHGLETFTAAYLSSLRYDFRVLGAYLTRYVRGDTLVLIFGDHQPVYPIAGDSHSRATPLHVLSRRAALLQPFRARGCTPGLLAQPATPVHAMEDLALDLLRAYGPSSQAAP